MFDDHDSHFKSNSTTFSLGYLLGHFALKTFPMVGLNIKMKAPFLACSAKCGAEVMVK